MWRIAVLDLPPGGISESASRAYAKWAQQYARAREMVRQISEEDALRAPSPESALASVPSLQELKAAEAAHQAAHPTLWKTLDAGGKLVLYVGGGFLLYQMIRYFQTR